MASPTFKFEYDHITPKMLAALPKLAAFLTKTTSYYALRAEQTAKTKATWTDRTGNARQGLRAIADNSQAHQGEWEISVSHSVPYGIWLEVRNSGEYAVILPTIDTEAPKYFMAAAKVFARMFN